MGETCMSAMAKAKGVTAFRSDIWIGKSWNQRRGISCSRQRNKKRKLEGNYRKRGNWGGTREENHHTNDPKLRPPKNR